MDSSADYQTPLLGGSGPRAPFPEPSSSRHTEPIGETEDKEVPMADSVRMMDLAALTRSLDEFRRLDPEHRVLAHRLATQAAVKRLEETHKDVECADRSAEGRLRPQERDEESRGGSHHGRQDASPDDGEVEVVPERNEGHILDIKV